MLDKTSKQVIQFLLNCPDDTFFIYNSFPEFTSKKNFLAAIDYLESTNYVTTKRTAEGSLISATLTHTGIHSNEFNSIALKRYLLDKWVDIIALIISILAFVGAYRHEIISVIRLLLQALTK